MSLTNSLIKYDDGVEGIRTEGEFRVPGGIERLPRPVPDLCTKKADGTWHYYHEDSLPVVYRDVSERERQMTFPKSKAEQACQGMWECGPGKETE